jgi:Ni/Co efflux regulator RcnB
VYPEFADFVLHIVKTTGIEGGSRNRADGILNAPSRVEVATMKSKQILMTALVGLAMLATPIVASAKDHKGDGRNYSHQSESRSFNVGNKHEYRNQGGNGRWAAAPVAVRRDSNAYRHDNGWHNGWRQNDGDADDYANYGYGGNYGNRGYYNSPAYVAPYYGRSGYASGGGGCAWAQHVRNVYARDRYTGHPAAARDLLPQLSRAEQSCGGAPNGGAGRGLFSGFAGAPAYQNYGRGYNGYNNSNYGGYSQPYGNGYGNAYGNGYGNGYGNNYGGGSSMLAPLLQQFVH